jgi:16S rRNA (cytidine1402-2'-O)-methyltransferase
MDSFKPMEPSLPPGLYIVATPIGNLSDLSPRASETLRGAELILAEDKRVSAKLLAHAHATAPMATYHDHSTEADRSRILQAIATKAVALVSDAGTPLISDPGYKLVRAVRAAGLPIFTIPGPCAAIAALTVAGLPTDRFLFAGFLPSRTKARRDAIAELAGIKSSLVVYESGPRLGECLADLVNGLGNRNAAVVREISKLHEECVTGTLGELVDRYENMPPKGEIVIVVGPPGVAAAPNPAETDAALADALDRLPPAKAAGEIAKKFGLDRKQLYARAMELKR